MNMKQKIATIVGTLFICTVMGIFMAAGALICIACRHEPLMIIIGGLMFSGNLIAFVKFVENDDNDELIEKEDAP